MAEAIEPLITRALQEAEAAIERVDPNFSTRRAAVVGRVGLDGIVYQGFPAQAFPPEMEVRLRPGHSVSIRQGDYPNEKSASFRIGDEVSRECSVSYQDPNVFDDTLYLVHEVHLPQRNTPEAITHAKTLLRRLKKLSS